MEPQSHTTQPLFFYVLLLASLILQKKTKLYRIGLNGVHEKEFNAVMHKALTFGFLNQQILI